MLTPLGGGKNDQNGQGGDEAHEEKGDGRGKDKKKLVKKN